MNFSLPQLSQKSQRLQEKPVLAAALFILALIVLGHSSVSEDAYITFRVVDNAVHGYGLRWNIDERVQVYTNPLWMLLHIPFYALWENIFWVTLLLSIACTVGAVVLGIYTFRKPWWQTVPFFIQPLILSSSFIDYSTSGLENPLTHLLFAAFGWALFSAREDRRWFWMSFFASLSLVNRLDTVVFYAPILAWLAFDRKRPIRIGQCLLGGLPIIGWEAFSLFYYGFPFPNTKYAKLNTGITEFAYICQGLRYLLNFIVVDGGVAAITGLAITAPFLWNRVLPRYKLSVPYWAPAVAMGILSYVLYIVVVGGNQVSGRFWTLPVFAAIWLVYGLVDKRASREFCIILMVALVDAKILYPTAHHLKKVCPECFEGRIKPKAREIRFMQYVLGMQVPPVVDRHSKPQIMLEDVVGMIGYAAGPAVHIVDDLALTDTLLARLPSNMREIQRIGHLPRSIPTGYMHALRTGETSHMNPALAEYYQKIHLIVAGPLFDTERLETIVAFNLGKYDYLRAQYVQSISGARMNHGQ